jgi:hypothetical protein
MKRSDNMTVTDGVFALILIAVISLWILALVEAHELEDREGE